MLYCQSDSQNDRSAPQMSNKCRREIFESDASIGPRVTLEDHFFDAFFGNFNLAFDDKTLEFFPGDETSVARVQLFKCSDQHQSSVNQLINQ